MPELPEMETYKTLLQQLIGNQTIDAVEINREKSINVPTKQFAEKIVNRKIETIERRAKYLIFRLQHGNGLLLHLMLGGWMFYGKEDERPNRTVQVALSFDKHQLYFIGLRLGYIHLLTRELIEQEFHRLGPEPLEPNFSIDAFLTIMKNRRGSLKTTLMNQEIIAGIGNRYSDEILWHAQLLPDRKVNELKTEQQARLYESMRFILQQGIKQGGYMQPLFNGDIKTGNYKMFVHGHEGKACPRCGTPIVNKVISSRNTYFCKNCQH